MPQYLLSVHTGAAPQGAATTRMTPEPIEARPFWDSKQC